LKLTLNSSPERPPPHNSSGVGRRAPRGPRPLLGPSGAGAGGSSENPREMPRPLQHHDSSKEKGYLFIFTFHIGATAFVATKGKDKLEIPCGRKITHLLATAGVVPDWNIYLPTLAPRSTVFPLSVAPHATLTAPYMPFLQSGIRLQGSIVAARLGLTKMLDLRRGRM
jgi:hypothetical protein